MCLVVKTVYTSSACDLIIIIIELQVLEGIPNLS